MTRTRLDPATRSLRSAWAPAARFGSRKTRALPGLAAGSGQPPRPHALPAGPRSLPKAFRIRPQRQRAQGVRSHPQRAAEPPNVLLMLCFGCCLDQNWPATETNKMLHAMSKSLSPRRSRSHPHRGMSAGRRSAAPPQTPREGIRLDLEGPGPGRCGKGILPLTRPHSAALVGNPPHPRDLDKRLGRGPWRRFSPLARFLNQFSCTTPPPPT